MNMEIRQDNSAFKVLYHGVPCLKFWVLENKNMIINRYLVVFDIPTEGDSRILRAFSPKQPGQFLFFAEIEEKWLSEAVRNPDGKDGFMVSTYDNLPDDCQSVTKHEIEEVLFHPSHRPNPAQRFFRVVFPDHTFDCFAENETHAAEQSADAEIDRGYPENVQILDVYLMDYAQV